MIDFSNAKDLISALRWVTDFDPAGVEGAAHKYVLLHQISGTQAVLSGWSMANTCLQRHISCSGPVDTCLLIDSEDLIQRCSSNEAFKDVSLRITKGKGNYVTVHSVKSILPNGKIEGFGKINIPTYPGFVGEFHKQEKLPIVIAVVVGEEFKQAVRTCDSYSVLRTDKCERHLMMSFSEGLLEMYSAEPGANHGFAYVYQKLSCTSVRMEEPLCIYGRFAPYISVGSSIEIKVDRLDNPTRIQFCGEEGTVTTSVVTDKLRVRYLTERAIYAFHGNPRIQTTEVSSRQFNCADLIRCVDAQRPRKNATRLDLVLEHDPNSLGLNIYKGGDTSMSEFSTVEGDLSTVNTSWVAITCNYKYLISALKLCAFLLRGTQFTEALPSLEGDSGFDFDLEGEAGEFSDELTQSPVLKLTELRIENGQNKHYLLLIDPVGLEGTRFCINSTARSADTDL